MVVELKLRAPDGDARRYRKPYVAVWIKDREGYPVRTLSVWVQKTQPGPRWYPDLRSWYRDEKILEMFENKSRIDAISGPTRAAGTYKVGWDGLDDQGQPVKPGKYTLLIESAREHGPYSLVKEALELGDQPLSKKVDGNGDIESLEYKFTGKLVAP